MSDYQVPDQLDDVRPHFFLPRGEGNQRYFVPATLAQEDQEHYNGQDEENYQPQDYEEYENRRYSVPDTDRKPYPNMYGHRPYFEPDSLPKDEEPQFDPVLPPPSTLRPLPPFAPDRPSRLPVREPMIIADRIPSSPVNSAKNYNPNQQPYSLASPERIKTTEAPQAQYVYGYTSGLPEAYATEPSMSSQPTTETPEPPNYYSYTRFSHGKPQDHGVWKPSSPFQEKQHKPPGYRVPRRRHGGQNRFRRPWGKRRWWQGHRRRIPATWAHRRRDHYESHRSEADVGGHRLQGRGNHRRLHPPFGQRRMQQENHDYDWANEDPGMASRWDRGAPHGRGRGPGWGAPGWHRGWLPPPHDRQGPGEARRGEPQYRGIIRVDDWSSPRVLDSMLGVSRNQFFYTFLPPIRELC